MTNSALQDFSNDSLKSSKQLWLFGKTNRYGIETMISKLFEYFFIYLIAYSYCTTIFIKYLYINILSKYYFETFSIIHNSLSQVCSITLLKP